MPKEKSTSNHRNFSRSPPPKSAAPKGTTSETTTPNKKADSAVCSQYISAAHMRLPQHPHNEQTKEIIKLKTELQITERERDRLKRSKEDSDGKIAELMKELQQARFRAAEASKAKGAAELREEKSNNLQGRFREEVEKRKGLERSYEMLESSSRSEIDSLNEKLDTFVKAHSAESQRRIEIESQRDRLKNQVEEAEAKLFREAETHASEMDVLQAEKAEMSHFQLKVEQHEATIEQLKKDADLRSNSAVDAELRFDEVRAQCRQYQESQHAAEQKYHAAVQERDRVSRLVERTNAENERAQQRIQQLEVELAGRSEDLNKTRQEKAAIRLDLEKVKQSETECEMRCKMLVADLKKIRNELDEASDNERAAAALRVSHGQEVDGLSSEIEELKYQLKQEKDQAENMAKDHERELHTVKGELAAVVDKAAGYEAQLTADREALAKTGASACSATEAQSVAEAALKECRTTLSNTTTRLTACQMHVEKLRAENDELQATVTKLNDMNGSMSASLNKKVMDYESLEQRARSIATTAESLAFDVPSRIAEDLVEMHSSMVQQVIYAASVLNKSCSEKLTIEQTAIQQTVESGAATQRLMQEVQWAGEKNTELQQSIDKLMYEKKQDTLKQQVLQNALDRAETEIENGSSKSATNASEIARMKQDTATLRTQMEHATAERNRIEQALQIQQHNGLQLEDLRRKHKFEVDQLQQHLSKQEKKHGQQLQESEQYCAKLRATNKKIEEEYLWELSRHKEYKNAYNEVCARFKQVKTMYSESESALVLIDKHYTKEFEIHTDDYNKLVSDFETVGSAYKEARQVLKHTQRSQQHNNKTMMTSTTATTTNKTSQPETSAAFSDADEVVKRRTALARSRSTYQLSKPQLDFSFTDEDKCRISTYDPDSHQPGVHKSNNTNIIDRNQTSDKENTSSSTTTKQQQQQVRGILKPGKTIRPTELHQHHQSPNPFQKTRGRTPVTPTASSTRVLDERQSNIVHTGTTDVKNNHTEVKSLASSVALASSSVAGVPSPVPNQPYTMSDQQRGGMGGAINNRRRPRDDDDEKPTTDDEKRNKIPRQSLNLF